MRRVALIVGSTGQDGILLSALLIQNKYRVIGISSTRCSDSDGAVLPAVNISDAAQVRGLIQAYKPTEIYYLAAFHQSSEQRDKMPRNVLWPMSFAINVEGYYNCLEAALEITPEARIFYASSSLIFTGDDSRRLLEGSRLCPSGIYGITKTTGFLLGVEYRSKHKLFVCNGILFNHESHLRAPGFLSRRVIEGVINIARGQSGKLHLGNIHQVVDWSHAVDFVSGFTMCLQTECANDYVFASGKGHSVQDFVQLAFEHVGLQWDKHIEVDSSRVPHLTPARIGDSGRLRALGWKPRSKFPDMIREIMGHFVSRQ